MKVSYQIPVSPGLTFITSFLTSDEDELLTYAKWREWIDPKVKEFNEAYGA